MEKLLNPYDKAYMRMAMLKHEETFREQVIELHRLYQIQKILMKNIASSRHNGEQQTRSNFKNCMTTNQINDPLDTSRRILQGLDLERPADEYNAETDGDGMVEMVDNSELELTLGPSSFYRRRKEADAPLLQPSDSGPSFSSSSSASSHVKRSSSNSHQKMNTGGESSQKWRLDMPISTPNFLGERKKSSDVEEQLRQDIINNPPWLFQVLSLNMT